MASSETTGPVFLIDDESGWMEEFGFVRKSDAATARDAIALLEREKCVPDGEGLRLIPSDPPTTWLKPGKGDHWDDCQQGDEGAVEFWRLELTDA